MFGGAARPSLDVGLLGRVEEVEKGKDVGLEDIPEGEVAWFAVGIQGVAEERCEVVEFASTDPADDVLDFGVLGSLQSTFGRNISVGVVFRQGTLGLSLWCVQREDIVRIGIKALWLRGDAKTSFQSPLSC